MWQPVVFLDYDGTLSPIVDIPDRAFMTEEMRGALSKVSSRFITAIVTGRSTEKVYNFVQLDNLVYAGSHGFDIKGPKTLPINCQVGDHFRPLLEQCIADISAQIANIPGAEIEDNRLAVSVHYRHVPVELQPIVEAIVDNYVALHPTLAKKHGKKVFELRPQVDWDKGRAVMFILAELGLDADNVVPFYVGDDVSDEDAFHALNARDRGKGISIIVRDPEATKVDLPGNTKELPATKALYSLRDTFEVEQFLHALASMEEVSYRRRFLSPFCLGPVIALFPIYPIVYLHHHQSVWEQMALRVVRASQRVMAANAKRPATVRFFSDAKTDDITDDVLQDKLRAQVYKDAERKVLPRHASPEMNPSVGDAPIPYPAECSVVSGVAEWSAGRKVHIFKPARHQMQSGTYATKHWEIRFDSAQTWQNPLMGWTSTAEPFHGMVMKFDKEEDAIAFAERQGWVYDIQEPAPVGDFEGELAYSHNFLPLDVENYINKHGKRAHVHFRHPTGRRSNWVKTLKYHGNGVVAQHGGEAKE
ncbi:TPA: hypothetical protein N0F65_000681 [Lagenidium giganteum]|uniref:Trehalose 6-phosphate phosphatase n=1 Tax=Lagenidium giganteum TaxID=4803 RepID=A0AAV2YTM0_9STRA|nr:TPA: hypothetical protein N0F65_000681 [Lagenidium giganteum]